MTDLGTVTVINDIILLGGSLLLVSILAGVLSSHIGTPLLLVFLGLGMLAGEDGPGGVHFNDFTSAYFLASVALAVILFDGGLRTSTKTFRLVWAPATVLSTVGVVLTAVVASGAAFLLLDRDWPAAFLVGATLASTDAAAVFLLLHQRGMNLRTRVAATLEVESGINDPMAVFLTATLVELIMVSHGNPTWDVLILLGQQVIIGGAVGIGGGFALARAVNRLELAPGLYPVFVVAGALTVFGATQRLDGSGFLAVYLAGIIAGSHRLRANTLIRRFHDGIAWVSQITLLVMLGLLVTPSKLLPDMLPAVGIALTLLLIARPLAVLICLAPFRFRLEEVLFIAWVGLRGAVPIYLAMIPVLGQVPNAMQFFNVAFIVVITSLIFQGWTVPLMARLCDVETPPTPEPAGRLDLDLPSQIDRELVGYTVRERSLVVNKPLSQVSLPRRCRLLAVLRSNLVVSHRILKDLRPGDYVLLICPPEQILALDRLFLPRNPRGTQGLPATPDFVFTAGTPLGAVADIYGLTVSDDARGLSLADFMRVQLGRPPSFGDAVCLDCVSLTVADMVNDEVIRIGLKLEPARWRPTVRGIARSLPGGRGLSRMLERIRARIRRLRRK